MHCQRSANKKTEKNGTEKNGTDLFNIKAEGLASAQLPALPSTEIAGLRRYPDQPVLSNQDSEREVIGSREDLVPNRAGALELPAVDVVWWNTHEDHLERTSLPPLYPK